MPFTINRTFRTASTRLLLFMVLAWQRTVCVGQVQPPVGETGPSGGGRLIFQNGVQPDAVQQAKPSEEQQRLIEQIVGAGGQYNADEYGETWTLRSVYLRDAAVADELLDLLAEQPSLQYISFYQTPLTDAGLRRVSRIKSLERLNLHSTLITDEGLKCLAALGNLKTLMLGSCEVTGEGLVALTHLPLEWLYVSSTAVDDDGLAVVGRMATLRNLSLWGAPVTDKGIAHLTRLNKLESINLKETIVTDAALEHLAKLPKLKDISVRGSLVTGPGLAHFGDSSELTSLDISRTGLRDKSLVHVFPMRHLTSIDLEQVKATQAGVRELWRVMPGLEIQGVETLHPGDEDTARQLLRDQGDLAIAEYDLKLLEESSPRKRELIQAMRLRDERVKSYHVEWKHTTVNENGTPDADEEVKPTQEFTLTVDGHRFASSMQGSEVVQNDGNFGNAPLIVNRTFLPQQPVTGQRVERLSRFNGVYDQQVTRYPDSNIPSTSVRQLAGRTRDTPMEMWPLLWTYSTFDRSISNLDWLRIEVVDEPETVDGRPCIQLRQRDPAQTGITIQNGVTTENDFTFQQTWFVDPSREHSIVRYTSGNGGQQPFLVMDIQHRQTDDDGWVPTSWTIRPQTGAGSNVTTNVTTAAITSMKLDIDTTDGDFDLEFPPGTGVD